MSARRRTAWWMLAGLIPGVMALIAESIPAHVPVAGILRPAAELQFEQYGVSYPLVRPFPVVEAPFVFQNRSPADVTIEAVEPSCGCLKWHFAEQKNTFAPGETGTLLVRMNTANERPGPHFYTLNVKTRGLRTHTEQLTFRVTLPDRKVSIEPAEVYFYNLNGRADSRTVYVTDYRQDAAAPLEVTGVESLSQHITAEVRPAEYDDQGRRRIPIVLSVPGDLPAARTSTFVRLVTSDPEFSHLVFPVLMQGVYGPPVDPDALVDIFEWVAPRMADNAEGTAH